jgi:hypothetical protein
MGVDLDIIQHDHGPFVTHTHAGGSIPHDHLLRAICHDPRCEGFETHNIHPLPGHVPEGTEPSVGTSELNPT